MDRDKCDKIDLESFSHDTINKITLKKIILYLCLCFKNVRIFNKKKINKKLCHL